MRRLLRWLHGAEDIMLVGLLVAMMLLACAQIILRNVFDDALIWADPMLRVMVLWVGLCGAMVATRNDKHIRIDLLTRLLSPLASRITSVASNLFAAAVCGVLAWHAGRFVAGEYEFETVAFANIPAWILASIIPIGFAVMSIRFVIRVFIPTNDEQSA